MLFTSVYKPYPKKKIIDDSIDFFYYRNTLNQGLFQMRQMESHHPLHFLAQNLPCDSVVLENPTWNKLVKEIKKNRFDVVCISFVVVTASRVLRMVKWLKAYNPDIDIIIGGYGTAIFHENYGIEKDIADHVDHVCTGEGLAFMKNYLHERWGITREVPYRQDFVPSKYSFFRTRLPVAGNLHFVMSLGCANRCAFCSTSSQFNKKVEFISGKKLYELIKEKTRRYPRMKQALIFEENFLQDRDKILEFKRYMEQDEELAKRPFYLSIFSSARSITQYTTEELLKCNIGIIFIGVESFRKDILEKEKLHKRGNKILDIKELFQDLHTAGIHTIGSIIIGWDDQTLDMAREDLDLFVGLNPTMYQVMPLQALPGTPLWKRMKKEGRIKPDFCYDQMRLERSSFEFKHFSQGASVDLIFKTYKELVNEGGPWIFRFFENYISGIKRLADSDDPIVRHRLTGYKKLLIPFVPLMYICRLRFHGKGFVKRWKRVMKEAYALFPGMLIGSFFLSLIYFPVLSLYSFLGNLRHHLLPHGDQPETIRMEYNNSEN